ncbi:MAG: hypothetical protein J6333_05535 [Planctomycetes bacterium]|nr:hypothetical protein [Planctomycetota bacterium]
MKRAIGCACLLIAAAVFGSLFVWYGCRIEPANGEIAVLIKKTGKNLPAGEIIATDSAYKGVQLEPLGEGRYFRNPYTWDWKILPITDIPAGKFGVLVRKFGADLPQGEIIAPDAAHKGIVREVLGTGKHRVNPYAYDVKVFNDIKILPGNVGVVTALCGADIFSGAANDLKEEHGFLVAKGRKGVCREILKEGTHRINPFIESVSIVNIQSQRHEFSGDEAISFLTVDGFSVSLEGTVEFNILPEAAPRLTHEVGDMDDILQKLILPSVRGFTRIEGSKKSSTEFIVGESRQKFQDALENYLKANCKNLGIAVNSVLIRDIIAPQEVAAVIRKRELAQQEANKFQRQIEQARSESELQRQKMLAEQNIAKVGAETEKITAEIDAKQKQLERTIAAQAELEVAKIGYQTAVAEAAAKIKIAEAEQAVVTAENRAAAEVLSQQVAAYGGAAAYVRAQLYEKIAPGLRTLMLNQNAGPSFGLPVGAAPGGAGAGK